MARPKQQQERRDHFVRSARRLIVAQGLASLRLRHVAAEAGSSPALVSYYFPEFDELAREVYSEAVERFHVQRRQMIEQTDDPRDRLVLMVQSGLPSGPDDAMCVLLNEFGPQVARNSVVKALRWTLFDRQVSLYDSILRTGAGLGHFQLTGPAHVIGSNLVALEDAYGNHVLSDGAVKREQAVSHLFEFASSATQCDLTGFGMVPQPA